MTKNTKLLEVSVTKSGQMVFNKHYECKSWFEKGGHLLLNIANAEVPIEEDSVRLEKSDNLQR